MTTPDHTRRHQSESDSEVATQDEPSLFEKCHRFFDPSGDYARVKEADLYPYFRPIEESEGSRAVMNGNELVMAGPEILHENLKNVRMTENDLYAKLRQANVTRRDQIRAVVMETTGDVSVLHADPDGQPLEDELLYGVENADRLREEAG